MSHNVSSFIMLYTANDGQPLDMDDTKARILHIADSLANDENKGSIWEQSISSELLSMDGAYVVIANGHNWPRIDFRLFAESLAKEFQTKVLCVIRDEGLPYDEENPCEAVLYTRDVGQFPRFKKIGAEIDFQGVTR